MIIGSDLHFLGDKVHLRVISALIKYFKLTNKFFFCISNRYNTTLYYRHNAWYECGVKDRWRDAHAPGGVATSSGNTPIREWTEIPRELFVVVLS